MSENTFAQPPEIKIQSPLALIGAFLYVVRERFTPENNLAWKWTESPETSDIIIEAQFNRNTEVPDKRPGIFVDKDQTVYGKVTLGNRSHNLPEILRTGLTEFILLAQTDITIDCVSPSRGESMQLADMVQGYLECSKYVIMKTFGIRDFSALMSGRTQPFAKQDDLHQTTINFRVEYEVRWATVPIAPTLRRLAARINTQYDDVLADMYLKSLSKY